MTGGAGADGVELMTSVVVPVRNGAAVLRGCLDALAAQTLPPDDVIVVDNGSTDGSGDLARAHPVVTRVVVERQPGSYAARNAGIAVARGLLLAFTDADCRPYPDWLEQGHRALRHGPASVAGGDVVAELSARPTIWERYDRATYLDQGRAIRDEGYAATANLFVSRGVLQAVGWFDPRLRSSGDLEWGQRATSMGHRIVHVPEAKVAHLTRRTAGETWRLHRRLGAGWRDLAREGQRPPAWREPALRVPVRWVAGRMKADGLPISRPQVVAAHAFVTAARVTGRLLGG